MAKGAGTHWRQGSAAEMPFEPRRVGYYVWRCASERGNVVKPEYILVGVLLLIGAVAVPAVKDVYLVQSFVLSICSGLGIQ